MHIDIDDYKKYSKYSIKYFGNTKISNKFIPEILKEFTLPAHFTVNDDGIVISQNSVYDISYLFSILESDNKGKEDEMKKVLIKMENTIQKYKVSNDKSIQKNELKKCIIGINKLNEKYNFIMTLEAEELCNRLIEISKYKGILEEEAEKIIENNREW